MGREGELKFACKIKKKDCFNKKEREWLLTLKMLKSHQRISPCFPDEVLCVSVRITQAFIANCSP